MNLAPLRARPLPGVAAPRPPRPRTPPGPLSRRRLVRVAAGGAAALGMGAALWSRRRAHAHGGHQPVPIPGGAPAFLDLVGTIFHTYGPGIPGFGADDDEPSTITDFDGYVGLTYVNGMCTRTNTATGEMRELPFLNSDMRFMTGVYRGVDGQLHRGTFAFI